MTQFYYYRNAIDATVFSVGLASPLRLGQLEGLTELAEHLQSGSCTLTFDDPSANLGHSSDAILGNQRIEITETACSAPRLYSAFTGIRTYQRGDGERTSLITGASRQISVELHDYNAYASMRVMPQTYRTAIRPRETVSARFAWITGTGYLAAVSDTGYVVANSVMMDKADYRGQRPVNVLNDCELAAGFGWNCFIFWDDAASGPAWFFDNANTSTAFSSTLRISNVLSDLDTTTAATFLTGTTFAPSKDARLSRDPTELGDSAYLPYRNGAVMRTRAATTATYGQKDIVAPNANVGSKTRAQAIADDFLYQHRNEEDRITLTVEVPPSKVNLIKAGHRIQVKFAHLPGYESFTWCRVLRRSPAQTQKTDDRYEMELELSPQEEVCAVGIVQQKEVDDVGHTSITFDNPVTVGDLIVAIGVRRGTAAAGMQTAGFTDLGQILADTCCANPGDAGIAFVFAKVATSTSQTYDRLHDAGQYQWRLYELSKASISATVVSKTNQAGTSTMNLGSLSGAGVAIMVEVVSRGTDQAVMSGAYAMGSWTERFDNQMDPTVGNPISGPWMGVGDISPLAGATTAASWTYTESGAGQTIGRWGGIAALFGPSC